MCHVHLIHKYDCGHQEISPGTQKSSLCLFDRGVCNASDLGRYRVCHVTLNKYCTRCQPVANSMRMHGGQWKKGAAGPAATVNERNKQRKLERDLKAQAKMPMHLDNVGRARQLNLMATRNLEKVLEREDTYTSQVYADIVRYIASLPRWLDRRALVESMQPWFAQLFDEDLQLSLRPTLRFIFCEDMLDDLMVWTARDVRLES
ncbi:uncharacterized protein F4812DRAFT_214668 [Daldinia caldariorum]|uniref:uncharacterized protein n=1 Tax=Daldinia caldariorum TaxID=326644 RepID=UPI002008B9E4|nr:uncharacterized protein F4812DRAFT_214668 [Daldinia caldariorum]KAI1464166.1 hypothetical protein F4812DRAFT_214668 [Daldinia caldariorum]